MDLEQSDPVIAWSIAYTDVHGRKTRIATYTFVKIKYKQKETEGEHRE